MLDESALSNRVARHQPHVANAHMNCSQCDQRILTFYLIVTYFLQDGIINYSHHTVHYVSMTYLFITESWHLLTRFTHLINLNSNLISHKWARESDSIYLWAVTSSNSVYPTWPFFLSFKSILSLCFHQHFLNSRGLYFIYELVLQTPNLFPNVKLVSNSSDLYCQNYLFYFIVNTLIGLDYLHGQ